MFNKMILTQLKSLYNSRDSRLDTIMGNPIDPNVIDDLKLLKKVHTEYMSMNSVFDFSKFSDYVKDSYGIQLFWSDGGDAGGGISGFYEVVDQQKYLLLKLKY